MSDDHDNQYIWAFRDIDGGVQSSRREIAGWLEQMGEEHRSAAYLKAALDDLRDAVVNISNAIEELEG